MSPLAAGLALLLLVRALGCAAQEQASPVPPLGASLPPPAERSLGECKNAMRDLLIKAGFRAVIYCLQGVGELQCGLAAHAAGARWRTLGLAVARAGPSSAVNSCWGWLAPKCPLPPPPPTSAQLPANFLPEYMFTLTMAL